MSEPEVRPYRCEDRAAGREIAADTAFFGEPVEAFMDDRRLFCDELCTYYTDFEPEHCWVAVGPSGVTGFVLGCVDTGRYSQVWLSRILPRLVVRALTGRYRLGSRTMHYALDALGAARRGEFPTTDQDAYPAHLHINLRAGERGRGVGRRLLSAYLEQIKDLQVRGVHLHTTSLNEAAVHLYERMGFVLLDARPTRLWSRYVAGPVENRTYGLRLAP